MPVMSSPCAHPIESFRRTAKKDHETLDGRFVRDFKICYTLDSRIVSPALLHTDIVTVLCEMNARSDLWSLLEQTHCISLCDQVVDYGT